MNPKLKNIIKKLPDTAGVYIFKDEQGRIIYIGKAKSLRKRVQAYFSHFLSTKTQAMVAKIAEIEYRIAGSESQAQLLEASLIKQHLPIYNISLKDDKSFPLIRITDEEFPAINICRRKKISQQDTSLYLGPYTNAKLLRQALRSIRKIFGFRSCRRLPKKICLYGRINLCPAPCIGKISIEDYQEIIQEIKMFLTSQNEKLIEHLNSKMQLLAKEKRFEEAARIRDQIYALSVIFKSQKTYHDELEDLKNLLGLKKIPERIEAFDVSNLFGKEACGSMVSFYKGVPDKANYRRFRIKTVEKIDDYKMLAEILFRRYSRVIRENLFLPDLILIDGGRSHLLTAQRQLLNLGLKIPLAGIAKDKENIYIPDKAKPIRLDLSTPALNLIRRIRDEAHRFAISYHRLLRKKSLISDE
ncbi:MAG: excinuclease ABC subunit UvrC [Candidatus Omnitrophica bacterium]|nr:excinuclease ABC subunit UvrC [Candidatus Omnitrophota bacterium]